jgi:hypothetical protein
MVVLALVSFGRVEGADGIGGAGALPMLVRADHLRTR